VTAPPPSPRARRLETPSWLDTRLVLGVLLVLVSVVVGARVLAAADRSQLVWAAAGDLAAGSAVSPDDVRAVQVRLFDSAGHYLAADRPVPEGYVVRQSLRAGQLVPVAALAPVGDDVQVRQVTVPVEAGHLPPDLVAGQQVDVWATPRADAPAAVPARPGPAEPVLGGVAVVRVGDDGGFSGATATSVVLQVEQGEVAVLVAAMTEGRIDLVRVPAPPAAGLEAADEAG
jgi:hypothetical protein